MGNPNMKQFSVQRLKELGKTDLLRRLIAKETNPNVRDQLNQFLNGPAAPIYQRSSIRTRVRPVPRVPDCGGTCRRKRGSCWQISDVRRGRTAASRRRQR